MNAVAHAITPSINLPSIQKDDWISLFLDIIDPTWYSTFEIGGIDIFSRNGVVDLVSYLYPILNTPVRLKEFGRTFAVRAKGKNLSDLQEVMIVSAIEVANSDISTWFHKNQFKIQNMSVEGIMRELEHFSDEDELVLVEFALKRDAIRFLF